MLRLDHAPEVAGVGPGLRPERVEVQVGGDIDQAGDAPDQVDRAACERAVVAPEPRARGLVVAAVDRIQAAEQPQQQLGELERLGSPLQPVVAPAEPGNRRLRQPEHLGEQPVGEPQVVRRAHHRLAQDLFLERERGAGGSISRHGNHRRRAFLEDFSTYSFQGKNSPLVRASQHRRAWSGAGVAHDLLVDRAEDRTAVRPASRCGRGRRTRGSRSSALPCSMVSMVRTSAMRRTSRRAVEVGDRARSPRSCRRRAGGSSRVRDQRPKSNFMSTPASGWPSSLPLIESAAAVQLALPPGIAQHPGSRRPARRRCAAWTGRSRSPWRARPGSGCAATRR